MTRIVFLNYPFLGKIIKHIFISFLSPFLWNLKIISVYFNDILKTLFQNSWYLSEIFFSFFFEMKKIATKNIARTETQMHATEW